MLRAVLGCLRVRIPCVRGVRHHLVKREGGLTRKLLLHVGFGRGSAV